MADPVADAEAAVQDALRFVTVRSEDGGLIGDTPTWFGEHLFGGFLIGQAVHAATRTAPEGRRIHSLHAYFLRAATAGKPLSFEVATLRDGRTFATRRVEATQDGTPVLAMMCSFTADTDGDEYELRSGQDVPGPDELTVSAGPTPWVKATIGPSPPDSDGTRSSTHRMWFRVPGELPDDPHLHAALIAFATDWTGTGGRPLQPDGKVEGIVSLDHTVWFHRPVRADEWLLYDVHSLVNAGGRGVLRGTMHRADRSLVVSVAQEMRLRPQSSSSSSSS
jgi:acyl-CoA thioesterase II